MQVSGHLTQMTWVGHASLAGVPRNSSSQLLGCIFLLQFSHWHLFCIKLACSAPL